jgi:hypothetical protein
MIVAAKVERFRGLQHLEVDGFGRVNLIVGKNDCGKTALMEAVWIGGAAGFPREAAVVQQHRLPNVPVNDFDRFWLPMFWRHDPSQGFCVSVSATDSGRAAVTYRQAPPPADLLSVGIDGGGAPAWALNVETQVNEDEAVAQIVATAEGIWVSPGPRGPASTTVFVPTNKNITASDIRRFSKLKQSGRDLEVLEILRHVDERVSSIELLSPTGSEAEVFVRIAPDAPLLPLAIMGDGFQRCFEIGVAAAGLDGPGLRLFIDEIDNGLHHSTLEPIWRWLATISKQRDLQVFATTHSEECIHAAARAFTALDDDGLRVIRLDRHEDRTTAAIYDRDLVEATERMDLEIRG